jgi:hypothetical protein
LIVLILIGVLGYVFWEELDLSISADPGDDDSGGKDSGPPGW